MTREIDDTFVSSSVLTVTDNTSFSSSVRLRGIGKLPQLRSWSRAGGNLIRRLRCAARASTRLNQTVFASLDAMRSRAHTRTPDGNRQERYYAGASCEIYSLILFASAKNCIDQLSLGRRMPTVMSKFLPGCIRNSARVELRASSRAYRTVAYMYGCDQMISRRTAIMNFRASQTRVSAKYVSRFVLK